MPGEEKVLYCDLGERSPSFLCLSDLICEMKITILPSLFHRAVLKTQG